MHHRINSVLELLDPPKGFKPWHGGPTLSGALRGVDYEQAQWKPYPGRHSIWELVLHIGYWRYAVRRHLDPRSEKGFGRSPANWPVVLHETPEGWKKDKLLVQHECRQLVEAIKRFSPERLDDPVPDKTTWTYDQLLNGIAAHDVYHIGQIQLMKRLYKEKFTH